MTLVALRRFAVSLLATALVLLAHQLVAMPTASAATWATQSSGTTVSLSGVSCPNTYTCWASGDGGTILRTVDGGTTWTLQRSGGYAVTSISCPTTTTCWATVLYDLITTNDGGATWSLGYRGPSGFSAISCATVASCVAVGNYGAAVATSNGGATWTTTQPSPNGLADVECRSATTCWAGGYGGTVVSTNNGGQTWSTHATGTSFEVKGVGCQTATSCKAAVWNDEMRTSTGGAFSSELGAWNMWDVACPVTSCWSVGPNGGIASNASGSWQAVTSPTSNNLRRVSCPTDGTCWAVGAGGTILAMGPGTPPTPSPTPTPTPPPVVPCANGTSIVEGYFGGTFARLRTQGAGSEVTICYQVNGPGVAESGRLVVGDLGLTAPLPVVDDAVTACDAPGNTLAVPHPILSALVAGDQRVFLDARTANGTAAVCFQAGPVAKRVLFTVPGANPSVTPYRDEPARPAEAHLTGPAGYPSSTCSVSGEIVNGIVGGSRVYAAAVQPNASRLDVCFRAEGPAPLGGRLTVDLNGFPGVTPVFTQGSNLGACTVPLIQMSSPTVLDVLTSAPGVTPVSVCVRTIAGTQTYSADVAGSPNLDPFDFTSDPGTL